MSEDRGGAREKMIARLSELLTVSDNFNQCVETDQHLARLLNNKLSHLGLGTVSTDLVLLENEIFTGYNDKNGEKLDFNA